MKGAKAGTPSKVKSYEFIFEFKDGKLDHIQEVPSGGKISSKVIIISHREKKGILVKFKPINGQDVVPKDLDRRPIILSYMIGKEKQKFILNKI